MALGTGVYGSNSSNAVTYSIGAVSSGGMINANKFNELLNNINSERVRRGSSSYPYSLSSPINHLDYNTFTSLLSVAGPGTTQAYNNNGTVDVITYPQVGAPAVPPDVGAGALITASAINNLISSIVSAGQVCTCNCNYCTCNCNYCTCNCNYSCTCNCNYSDERLKANITLVETRDGLNVYSYSYIWNKAKTYIGVLAQELIGTKYESALGLDKNGFYYVDYSQLPVNMTEA
jgi:hypothetical protein